MLISTFRYKNYKGEIKPRRVYVSSVDYIVAPGHNYESGWFITGFDLDKKARRSFALTNIILDGDNPIFRINVKHPVRLADEPDEPISDLAPNQPPSAGTDNKD